MCRALPANWYSTARPVQKQFYNKIEQTTDLPSLD